MRRMSEDWLPHEPPAAEPVKSSAAKTFAIWAILIVIFIALYSLAKLDHGTPPIEAKDTGFSGWWIVLAALAGAAVPILFIIFAWGGTKRFNNEQAPALEALAERRYARSAEMYAELARTFKTKPIPRAIALYNRGYALIRGGDSAAAVGVLLGVERTSKLASGGVRQLAVLQLSRAFAIGGDLDKATRWLEQAKTRAPGTYDPVHGKAMLLALEGLVMCRQGRVEDAVGHYQQCWPLLEGNLSIQQMEEAWLVRAFAITATSSPRDTASAEPFLRMLRSCPPGAFHWLTAHWPELATFTITHGLAAEPPPAAPDHASA
jgi:hypothetical protein